MNAIARQELRFALSERNDSNKRDDHGERGQVSAIYVEPAGAICALGHGAGAGMPGGLREALAEPVTSFAEAA